MAEALKPSIQITEKQNVTPSINRITEATAEDFQEIGNILLDHANKLNEISRTDEEAEYYGVHGSLAGVQAAFPDAPNSSWAVINPGDGNPKNMATVVNGAWEVNQLIAPILIFNTKLDRPAPGVEEIIYVVKDEKIFSLWYDNKYNDFGKDGNNGLSAYQVAVAFAGFEGTEVEWVESLKGKDNYQLWLDAGNIGDYNDFLEASRGPEGPPGPIGEVTAAQLQTVQDEVTNHEGRIQTLEASIAGNALVAYATMASLYAAQGQQVANGSYRVDDASAHPQVTAGRAWFDYKGTTAGTETDYILRSEEESMNLDAQLTAIENRLTAVENGKADTRFSNLAGDLTPAEKTGVNNKLRLAPLVVNASRNLALTDNGRKLYVTANSTLTYPTAGLGADFNCNIVTAATITATIAGTTLLAPTGTILLENKMGHCFVEPVNSKLSLNGGFTQ